MNNLPVVVSSLRLRLRDVYVSVGLVVVPTILGKVRIPLHLIRINAGGQESVAQGVIR
jgi:hypothetical protein